MLEFGNKEFRNLQEQVEKNQDDILKLKQGGAGHEPIPGPQGEQGLQGEQGPKGEAGNGIYGCASTLPSAGSYKYGDFFLLFNGELYKNVQGIWRLQTTLKGPQGPIGNSGELRVIANPVEEYQDIINTIKIGDVVYKIALDNTTQEYLTSLQNYLTVDNTTGKIEAGHDFEVDGDLIVNDFDNIKTKVGNKVLSDELEDINDKIDAIKLNAFKKVDTETYPTLDDFLSSTGEEGITYLYPTTTEGQYYQYIWEDDDWISLGTMSTPIQNVVTTDTNQTITGVKTFTNEIKIGNFGLYPADTNEIQIRKASNSIFRIQSNLFMPFTDNNVDLGNSTHKFKDLYLSGNISDGTNSASVSNIINGTFNVINASEIVNNTLTQAQFNLMTNGKPTLIKGSFRGYTDAIFKKPVNYGTVNVGSFEGDNEIGGYIIQESKVLDIRPATTTVINLRSVGQLNGKTFPTYPSSPATPKTLVYGTNNTLSWEEYEGMSAEEKAKLSKALVIPTPAITGTELVGVDSTKSQVRVTIGSGLTLNNGTLSASGGGGGGTQLYEHVITISNDDYFANFVVISSKEDAYESIYGLHYVPRHLVGVNRAFDRETFMTTFTKVDWFYDPINGYSTSDGTPGPGWAIYNDSVSAL